jgi:hypothetical protein
MASGSGSGGGGGSGGGVLEDGGGALEQQLVSYIKQHSTFEQLPSNIRQTALGNSKEVWRQCVYRYSIKHQLRWKTSLVRAFAPDERIYYQDLVKTSRTQLMVHPLLFSSFFFLLSSFLLTSPLSLTFLSSCSSATPPFSALSISHFGCVGERTSVHTLQVLLRNDV